MTVLGGNGPQNFNLRSLFRIAEAMGCTVEVKLKRLAPPEAPTEEPEQATISLKAFHAHTPGCDWLRWRRPCYCIPCREFDERPEVGRFPCEFYVPCPKHGSAKEEGNAD